ncbi:MAG: flagellar hook-length control protein FliK, partial [Spirochaetota bacterium]
LQMQDGHIAGRIIVDNQSVRDAFEQNLAALQKAFAEGGMDASGLEVTVADSGRDSGQTDDGSPGNKRSGAAAATFDNAVPTVNSIDERHDLVDLIV